MSNYKHTHKPYTRANAFSSHSPFFLSAPNLTCNNKAIQARSQKSRVKYWTQLEERSRVRVFETPVQPIITHTHSYYHTSHPESLSSTLTFRKASELPFPASAQSHKRMPILGLPVLSYLWKPLKLESQSEVLTSPTPWGEITLNQNIHTSYMAGGGGGKAKICSCLDP